MIMLRTLRRNRTLTQAQLAKRARISQPYIANLERGKNRNPSLAVLQRLAKALGVTTTAVVEAIAGQEKGRRQ